MNKEGDKYGRREKDQTKMEKTDDCYNCGGKGHKSKDYPNKSKETKCFKCNSYGHIAAKCSNNANRGDNEPSPSAAVNTIEVIPKNGVRLEIDNVNLLTLLDTGSDINAIR